MDVYKVRGAGVNNDSMRALPPIIRRCLAVSLFHGLPHHAVRRCSIYTPKLYC
jgi:hypothetical protein